MKRRPMSDEELARIGYEAGIAAVVDECDARRLKSPPWPELDPIRRIAWFYAAKAIRAALADAPPVWGGQ